MKDKYTVQCTCLANSFYNLNVLGESATENNAQNRNITVDCRPAREFVVEG